MEDHNKVQVTIIVKGKGKWWVLPSPASWYSEWSQSHLFYWSRRKSFFSLNWGLELRWGKRGTIDANFKEARSWECWPVPAGAWVSPSLNSVPYVPGMPHPGPSPDWTMSVQCLIYFKFLLSSIFHLLECYWVSLLKALWFPLLTIPNRPCIVYFNLLSGTQACIRLIDGWLDIWHWLWVSLGWGGHDSQQRVAALLGSRSCLECLHRPQSKNRLCYGVWGEWGGWSGTQPQRVRNSKGAFLHWPMPPSAFGGQSAVSGTKIKMGHLLLSKSFAMARVSIP